MLYEYAPGTGLYVRDNDAVQFGIDATRMGVIEIPNPETLIANLSTLTMPATQDEWCAATGLESVAAKSLFDDLVAFGTIRVIEQQHNVAMVGNSALFRAINILCNRHGINTYQPKNRQSITNFLSSIDNDIPVIFIDQLAHSKAIANALDVCGTRTWLTISAVDNRGFLGPIHVDGEGPCPVCFDLIKADTDPRWPLVTKQVTQQSHPIEPAVTNVIAGHAVLTISRLLGLSAPPGTSNSQFMPGEFFEIDPYGKNQQRLFSQHHLCPICFDE